MVAQAKGSQVQGQAEPHSEILPQNPETTTKK
jgi:hypothetical protein